MKFTDAQTAIIDQLRENIERGDQLTEEFLTKFCEAFDGHVFTNLVGIGGTRFVIAHPDLESNEDRVLKVAFNEDGIAGNRDEYRLYHETPEPVKSRLGCVGELLCDGILLEMTAYELLTESEFPDYNIQLGEILECIEFPHYDDPPYHHSFGVSPDGTLMLIDYGETETFILKGKPPDKQAETVT